MTLGIEWVLPCYKQKVIFRCTQSDTDMYCCYLSSLFLKPVMFACLSWDLGFKKTRPILLYQKMMICKSQPR